MRRQIPYNWWITHFFNAATEKYFETTIPSGENWNLDIKKAQNPKKQWRSAYTVLEQA